MPVRRWLRSSETKGKQGRTLPDLDESLVQALIAYLGIEPPKRRPYKKGDDARIQSGELIVYDFGEGRMVMGQTKDFQWHIEVTWNSDKKCWE